MTNRGQAQYLRIFDETTTYTRWQSYYVNQTVTWQSASWEYFPFKFNGLIGGTPGGDTGATIDLPATEDAVTAFTGALSNNYLCQLLLYEFNTSLSQSVPQASQYLIGSFTGEVTGISGSFALLRVNLGSSLAPVGAQVPPRKFNSTLIGAPIKI